MTITGTLHDIAQELEQYEEVLRQSPYSGVSVTASISLSAQNKRLLFVDKRTLQELNMEKHYNAEPHPELFLIEEDIYRLFQVSDHSIRPVLAKPENTSENSSESAPEIRSQAHNMPVNGISSSPIANSPSKTQTALKKPKTANDFPKAKSTKIVSLQNDQEERAVLTTLGEHYVIEDHLEDSVRLEKPCAFAIKYIDQNCFYLYYRRSVYDKGTDTTFRHYLCNQPGELVAYMYFKALGSLRNVFEKHGLKLRHNGKNILSRMQSDEVVDYFTKCWI